MTHQSDLFAALGFTKVHATGAEFSPERAYRYRLWREWGGTGALVCWVMLNPSTADETIEDPTIRRCIGFARAWRCRGIEAVNLFALRSTDPKALYDHADPVGPENDDAIALAAARADIVIAAWGVHGTFLGRGDAVVGMLARRGIALSCLGTTKDGHPRHPLYVAAATERVRLGGSR